MATKTNITLIQDRLSPAATLPTINQNFQLLADGINSLNSIVDPVTQISAGLVSLSVVSSSNPVTDTLINTNGSINAGGNMTVGRIIQAQSALIDNNITLNTGSLILSSENSRIDCAGKFILNGEYVMSDFGSSQIINASYINTWSTSTLNNLIVSPTLNTYAIKTTANSNLTPVGGLLSLIGRSGIILNWDQFSSDASHMLDVVMLDTTGISAGFAIKIIAKLGNNSGGHTFKIAPNNIAYPSGKVLNGINFTESYQTVELIFDGINFIVFNTMGAIMDWA